MKVFVPDLVMALVTMPGGPAELGADGAPLDAELGDVELGEVGAEGAEERVGDVRAVIQEDVVLLVAAGVGGEVAVVGDAGGELEERGVGPAQRQLLDGLFLPVRSDLGGLEVDDRRAGGR